MASKLLTVAKLIRSSHRSPFAGRLYFASSPADDRLWLEHIKAVANLPTKPMQMTIIAAMNHPFMTQGSSAMGYVEQYSTKAIVKVDMPGIGKQGLNIRLKGSEIHIEGDAEKEDDGLVRRYCGVLDLPPGFYNTHEIEASITLGVLKMLIPKLRPTINPVPAIEFRGWGPIHTAKMDEKQLEEMRSRTLDSYVSELPSSGRNTK